MTWIQKEIRLGAKSRGFHLVTDEVTHHLPELAQFEMGIAHFFILHTSASLTINENADPDVRTDLEAHFNILAPENARHYRHVCEGPDDMPAHIKASLLGSGLTIPIRRGTLALGTWQGLTLCEHRNHGGRRRIVVTLNGQIKSMSSE